jgi:hypothetical protein
LKWQRDGVSRGVIDLLFEIGNGDEQVSAQVTGVSVRGGKLRLTLQTP